MLGVACPESEQAMFMWNSEELRCQLPVAPGATATFVLEVSGQGDFLLPAASAQGSHLLAVGESLSKLTHQLQPLFADRMNPIAVADWQKGRIESS